MPGFDGLSGKSISTGSVQHPSTMSPSLCMTYTKFQFDALSARQHAPFTLLAALRPVCCLSLRRAPIQPASDCRAAFETLQICLGRAMDNLRSLHDLRVRFLQVLYDAARTAS
jgi:hypothetical protein